MRSARDHRTAPPRLHHTAQVTPCRERPVLWHRKHKTHQPLLKLWPTSKSASSVAPGLFNHSAQTKASFLSLRGTLYCSPKFLPVNISSVSHAYYKNQQCITVDIVDDAIITHANPIGMIGSYKLLRSNRCWIIRQFFNRCNDSWNHLTINRP